MLFTLKIDFYIIINYNIIVNYLLRFVFVAIVFHNKKKLTKMEHLVSFIFHSNRAARMTRRPHVLTIICREK